MTTLISWFGRDSRGPASIYIASDSRITWSPTPATWDRARKIFASQRYPEVFGYCGDAFFPTQLLGQAVDLLDRDLLFPPAEPSTSKATALQTFLHAALREYTDRTKLTFELVYASREGEGILCRLHLHVLSYRQGNWLSRGPATLPNQSGLLENLGTGQAAVASEYARWTASSSGGTSRAVFSAFCDALQGRADASSGGPPQLVGIYRKGPAHVFGVIFSGSRFVLGSEPLRAGSSIEWRNTLFERCDPNTLQALHGAQLQPRPPELPAGA